MTEPPPLRKAHRLSPYIPAVKILVILAAGKYDRVWKRAKPKGSKSAEIVV